MLTVLIERTGNPGVILIVVLALLPSIKVGIKQNVTSWSRYSILLDLPYFDPVRMTVVDPMHNLFLGTAKYLIKNVWIQQDILTKSTMMAIQNTIDSMSVPTDLGRIPCKIQSGFDHFTADQLKNWVNLYSIPCLYGILSSDHLENWRYFDLACRILCCRSLSL